MFTFSDTKHTNGTHLLAWCWMAKDQWDLDRGCPFLHSPSNQILPANFSLILRDDIEGAETSSLLFPNTWLLPKGLLPHFPSPVKETRVWFCLWALQGRQKNEKWEAPFPAWPTFLTTWRALHYLEQLWERGQELRHRRWTQDCWKSIGG